MTTRTLVSALLVVSAEATRYSYGSYSDDHDYSPSDEQQVHADRRISAVAQATGQSFVQLI